ncbi:tyrosine recombinase XerS [Latilactobacillus curvatus]|uniref:tyrosine recombinase XerS n=1 Tax=Latilactobacillus curvatus TaxID=28038 RepID=UPI0020A3A148|nr:tyrosine recombinase XerS [Latilactobacillus curvatus]
MDQQRYLELCEKQLANLPDYIRKFYINRQANAYSSATLYQYLQEYIRFFTWLVDEQIVVVPSIDQMPLTALEKMKLEDIELYKIFLMNKRKQNNHKLSFQAVNRSINALNALWYFLTIEAEQADGEPYFYRNVMKKVKLLKASETMATRSRHISKQLLTGEKKHDFITFMQVDYPNLLSNRQLASYKQNCERDIAICVLALATGIRLSELAQANINDLNLEQLTITVIRKGGQQDTVPIAPWSLPFLRDYCQIRKSRYLKEDNEQALFVSRYRGSAKRMSNYAIEKLVAKYSEAFGVRLTPHKFRHTLATDLMAATHSETIVATQLGQTTTQATHLYTHVVADEQRSAMDQLE